VMKSRKHYMKNIYSKYWINARKNIYGSMPYDHAMVEYVLSLSAEQGHHKLLEVAIGTGEPIASTLSESGLSLFGVDISPELVDECRKNNPHIPCEVGDAEQLKYEDGFFDLAYCLHSSWFIPDIEMAIHEMLRVVRSQGSVVIDIQNHANNQINKIYKIHKFENEVVIGKFYKTFKNSAKWILQKGTQDWPFIVSQTP
jgi:ubiquinone/menaquinone biosynthesis C-methylase UbiE